MTKMTEVICYNGIKEIKAEWIRICRGMDFAWPGYENNLKVPYSGRAKWLLPEIASLCVVRAAKTDRIRYFEPLYWETMGKISVISV